MVGICEDSSGSLLGICRVLGFVAGFGVFIFILEGLIFLFEVI